MHYLTLFITGMNDIIFSPQFFGFHVSTITQKVMDDLVKLCEATNDYEDGREFVFTYLTVLSVLMSCVENLLVTIAGVVWSSTLQWTIA